MKNVISILAIIQFFSCSQTQKNDSKEESEKVNYIYEATYLDDFKMGNPELVLKVQEMHQSIINKDYEKAFSYLSDSVVFALEDGSRLDGKEACMKFMIEAYSSISIEDYFVAVNLAVTGSNGDEWVLLWDNGKTVTSDGKETSLNWMESFRFDGDKIAFINQFSKSRN